MFIFLEFLVFVLLIVLIYIIVSTVFGKNKNFVKAGKVKLLFKKIDKKYAYFLKKNIDGVFLTSDNYKNEIDRLLNLSYMILKPEVKSIYTIIKLSGQKVVKIDYESDYFENSLAISEALYNRNSKNSKLTKTDEDDFYNSFKEVIKSDLLQKLYNDGFDKVNQSIK